MVGTPSLTQYYVYPGVSCPPPPIAKADVTAAIVPGKRDMLRRVMIESHRLS